MKASPKESITPAWFYILRLKSAMLYCGSTTNLNQHYYDHISGKPAELPSLTHLPN
jgi:predicted GIY-YIG superfamily endonuclease